MLSDTQDEFAVLTGFSTDENFRSLINTINEQGWSSSDRTGVGTHGVCFEKTEYPLCGGAIPLLNGKAVNLRPLLVELEWYLRGDTNIKFLNDNGVHIWDQWADDQGDLGPVYGKQWRAWEDTRIVRASDSARYVSKGYTLEGRLEGADSRVVVTRRVDQLAQIINKLRTNPEDRRIMLSAWNVAQLDDMALPPCHFAFYLWSRQLDAQTRFTMAMLLAATHTRAGKESSYTAFAAYVADGGDISWEAMDRFDIPQRQLCSSLMQRSVDVFVGLPFNLAGYGILTHFIAKLTGHMAMSLTHYGCDVHLYNNHTDAVDTYLSREFDPDVSNPAVIFPDSWRELKDFAWGDIEITGYAPQPWIKVPVAK
ncbi:thymidylate synthase [Klebsiella pneumoniae]|nr:thymidylate synthase [Klebsiella pneumoniae]